MKIVIKEVRIVLILLACLFTFTAQGQDEEIDPAKQAQNPLANIISMPFQNNTNFGIGDYSKTSNVVNIQPILPMNLGKRGWLLLNRFIIPLPNTVPDISSEEASSTTGLGDINYTGWVAPPSKGKLTYGGGLVTIWPTASSDVLGTGKFSMGPSIVLVYAMPKFLGAAVISDWKSVGGDSDRPDVHTFYFQYILTKFLPNKWYATIAPINLANWEAEEGQKWTVPLGGGFGKSFAIGKMPLDCTTQAYYNVVRPDMGPEWQWRFQIKLIFPKEK